MKAELLETFELFTTSHLITSGIEFPSSIRTENRIEYFDANYVINYDRLTLPETYEIVSLPQS